MRGSKLKVFSLILNPLTQPSPSGKGLQGFVLTSYEIIKCNAANDTIPRNYSDPSPHFGRPFHPRIDKSITFDMCDADCTKKP